MHAIEAIRNIEHITDGVDFERFKAEIMIHSACFYQFAVLAEAVSCVEREILDRYDYPWFKVKSFRNFLLHEYHAIELDMTFDTTKKILPGLKTLLLEILAKEFPNKL